MKRLLAALLLFWALVCPASPPLDRLEGIWEFTRDGVRVKIERTGHSESSPYSITVVSSRDCILPVGTRLGTMRPTARENQYELTLHTRRRTSGTLAGERKCVGTLGEKGRSMTIERVKGPLRFNLRSSFLLPLFWSSASMSATAGAKSQPGIVKISPSYDGNGSSHRHPRYM